jgi:hypothetical protein
VVTNTLATTRCKGVLRDRLLYYNHTSETWLLYHKDDAENVAYSRQTKHPVFESANVASLLAMMAVDKNPPKTGESL